MNPPDLIIPVELHVYLYVYWRKYQHHMILKLFYLFTVKFYVNFWLKLSIVVFQHCSTLERWTPMFSQAA